MKTSYFSQLKNINLKEENLHPIAVCLYPPNYYKGDVYQKLAPSNEMLMEFKKSRQTDADKERLENRYKEEILSKLDARQIYDELGDNALLLCFEKDFCHRHFIADWFKQELGIDVLEWQKEPIDNFHQISFDEYF